MGEPYFRIERLLKSKGVAVRSCDFALYGKVSQDVMRLLSRYTDAMETYSVDEAFMSLPEAERDPAGYADGIRRAMLRGVGVPVSIGVAPTKTLSKLASDLAKREGSGVLELSGGGIGAALDATAVEDVWGIGRKSAEHLKRWGVRTAGDFVRKDALWVKRAMSIRGVMTQYELTGRPCIPMETGAAPPKSIQVSRTWGSVLESYEDVERAVTDHALSAAASLRRDRRAAGSISVFVRHGYRHSGAHGYFSDEARFHDPLSSDFELAGAARALLRRLYRPGYRYTQGGVTLSGLSDAGYRQLSIFGDETLDARMKFERFSEAVDEINRRFGRVMYPAMLAVEDKKWLSRRRESGG
jgi:DNA polymerase V